MTLCTLCNGTGEIQDPDNIDYDFESDGEGGGGYRYCGNYIDCPQCEGRGEVLMCDHCAVAPATHFTAPDAVHDYCCEACYAKLWTRCPTCDAEVMVDDLVDRCVSTQTHWEPAEYETGCVNCTPEEYEDDRSADDADGWED